MSVSSRIFRNSSIQRSLRCGSPHISRSNLGPSSVEFVLLRHHGRRQLAPQLQSVTLRLTHRHYATRTTASGVGATTYPPPGFNAEEAKKPLPKEEASKPPVSTAAVESKPPGGSNTSANATHMARAAKNELSESKLDKLATTQAEEGGVAESKKDQKKPTFMQKVKREVLHYWDGTKLLATEVRISTKLALKMAAGYELSRRENRQLQRTVQDLARLVPFSVFIIVPFAELLLPVALKLFPNLLPSTYEGQTSKDAKAKGLRATRKEVSSFLRNTLKETGLPVSVVNAQKEGFVEFFRKVRATGESPTQDDVIKVCKIFKDDLTLDNLSRPQLVGMTKYMGLSAFGTDMMLRYQIRHRMRQIKRDDRAISFEGVETLSVPELQMACASRGLRTQGMSPGRLRDDLQMWLDLRLKYGVPSTLLVLSNAFMYTQGKDSEISSQIDALQAVLSSIPEELFHEIELEVHNAEGAATNKQRLEVLKEQQELIEEENEQSEESGESGRAPNDNENIDEEEQRRANAKTEEVREQEQLAEVAKAEQGSGERAKVEKWDENRKD